MKGARILVTGATGFIGQHLVKRLIEEDAEIYAVSKHGGSLQNVPVDPLDLTRPELINEYIKGREFDAIFHMAAYVPSSFLSTDAESSINVNVQMTKNILDILRKQNYGKFIYASSVAVYNKPRKNVILTEELNVRPANFYALGKYIGEVLGEMYTQAFGISSVSLRITAPYGPGNTKRTIINVFIEKALQCENLTLFGSGKRGQDFIYFSDIIDAMILSYKNNACGIFNIGSGKPISMKELASVVLETIPRSTSKIVYSGNDDPQENYYPNISLSKSSKLLGYKPKIDLREGLERTMQDCRSSLNEDRNFS
jgi:UDP-glucose 4-epimerase